MPTFVWSAYGMWRLGHITRWRGVYLLDKEETRRKTKEKKGPRSCKGDSMERNGDGLASWERWQCYKNDDDAIEEMKGGEKKKGCKLWEEVFSQMRWICSLCGNSLGWRSTHVMELELLVEENVSTRLDRLWGTLMSWQRGVVSSKRGWCHWAQGLPWL